MVTLRSWMRAARLRTLPLALSSIAMGGFVAQHKGVANFNAIIFAAITTLFLQILSNFANDYGDTVSGIDNNQRVGPRRTVQSGEISTSEMRSAIFSLAFLSLLSGIVLIGWVAEIDYSAKLVFLLIGIVAIVAAIKYTIGEKPYGYIGLGDVAVFLFFGLTAVGGTYYLATSSFDNFVLLPAAAMGLWSTAVLNLNNMRDVENDRAGGKRTIVVLLGLSNALIYHALLIIIPFVLLGLFAIFKNPEPYSFVYFIMLPFFLRDLIEINKIEQPALLDPYLKKLAIKILVVTIVFGIGLTL